MGALPEERERIRQRILPMCPMTQNPMYSHMNQRFALHSFCPDPPGKRMDCSKLCFVPSNALSRRIRTKGMADRRPCAAEDRLSVSSVQSVALLRPPSTPQLVASWNRDYEYTHGASAGFLSHQLRNKPRRDSNANSAVGHGKSARKFRAVLDQHRVQRRPAPRYTTR